MERESNILRRISENQQRSFIVFEEEEEEEEDEDTVMDAFSKPRKRRLDHLSWEEKVQRKKLKNRVAAQTSRDRKKARMEQLEENFDKLMAQNELVLAECETLKRLNETLRVENAELMLALGGGSGTQHSRRVECVDGHLSGSTARSGPTLDDGGGADAKAAPAHHQQQQQSPTPAHGAEDPVGMPSLQDLLDELNKDVDIGSLDELTQSLLADIACNLDAVDHDTKPEQPTGESGLIGEVVGPPSEQLEPNGGGSGVGSRAELAEFLLLHHDYSSKRPPPAATPPPSTCTTTSRLTASRNKRKLKPIMPKRDAPLIPPTAQRPLTPAPVHDETHDDDALCGYYDEAENCITIIVDDDQDIQQTVAQLQAQIHPNATTVIDDRNLLVPPALDSGGGFSSSASDGGYESLGSPSAFGDDFFDSSVSELFPQLI